MTQGSPSWVVRAIRDWATTVDQGMGLVTFESVSLRDQVIAEVTQALSALNWSVQTLRAADLNPRQFITSITASSANCLFVLDADHLLFGSDGEISPFWINFERERLVEHPGVQVWWMRPAGTILLGQQLPDLNRFFLFRERLQGADPVEARGPWEVGITEPRPSGPPAPSLARLLFDQALQAADAGAEPARVWLELGSPAVEAFLNSRDTHGAGEVLSALTSRIGPLNALLKRGIPNDAQASDLARAFMNQGNALRKLGRLEAALAAYDEAIRLLRRLIEEEGRTDLANVLAGVITNRGNALYSLGRLEAAATAYDKAIRILRRLVEEGRGELANDLARAIMNQGIALWKLGRLEAALATYDEAIRILRRLVEEEGLAELANHLAMAIMNQGIALRKLGRLEAALAAYDEAIRIRRRLVEEEGRGDVASDLARAIMNQGIALASLGRLDEAVAAYDEAIRIYRRLVEEARADLVNHLAIALYNLALARENQGHPQAFAAAREAREIWERLVTDGWAHLAGSLEDARKLESRLGGAPS